MRTLYSAKLLTAHSETLDDHRATQVCTLHGHDHDLWIQVGFENNFDEIGCTYVLKGKSIHTTRSEFFFCFVDHLDNIACRCGLRALERELAGLGHRPAPAPEQARRERRRGAGPSRSLHPWHATWRCLPRDTWQPSRRLPRKPPRVSRPLPPIYESTKSIPSPLVSFPSSPPRKPSRRNPSRTSGDFPREGCRPLWPPAPWRSPSGPPSPATSAPSRVTQQTLLL